MLGLAAADPPCQRTKRALRACVAVRGDQRAARKNDAEFGRYHMGDALVGIVYVEQDDACGMARCAGFGDESVAALHQRAISASGAGIDDMVHYRENASGIGNRMPCFGKAVERRRTGALVQENAVDSD